MDNRRDRRIDALRGWAIFLVVLGHAIVYVPVNLHEVPACELLFRWLSAYHMPLFFLLSGWCWRWKNDWRGYLTKKTKRLMLPYLIFGLLDMIPRQLAAGLVNRPRGVGESLVRILLYGGEFWFLYTLFLIMLLYPLLHRLTERAGRWSLAVDLGLLALAAFGIRTTLLCLDQLARYLFWFHLGQRARRLGQTRQPPQLSPFALWTAACAALALSLWFTAGYHGPGFPGLALLKALPGLVFSLCLARCGPFRACFAPFGEVSLQLYLLNGFSLVASRTLICSILGVTAPGAIIAFNMLADFGAATLFIRFFCARFRPLRLAMGMS